MYQNINKKVKIYIYLSLSLSLVSNIFLVYFVLQRADLFIWADSCYGIALY